jgi:hypothetical protein
VLLKRLVASLCYIVIKFKSKIAYDIIITIKDQCFIVSLTDRCALLSFLVRLLIVLLNNGANVWSERQKFIIVVIVMGRKL